MRSETATCRVEFVALEVMPHERHVRHLLLASGLAACDVNDVIQESYSRIVRSADPDTVRSAKNYFFAVALNIVRERRRSERVARMDDTFELHTLPDDSPSPDRIYEAREEVALVMQALDALPDRRRQIFLLRRVQGISQREVAQRLGVTENVVEKQVWLVANFLRQRLTLDRKGGARLNSLHMMVKCVVIGLACSASTQTQIWFV